MTGKPPQHSDFVDRSEFHALAEKVEKFVKPGWIAKYGSLIVAIAALLLSLVSSFFDLRSLRAAPDLNFAPEDTLLMSYYPKRPTATFQFALTIANYGTKDATITGVSGALERLTPSPKSGAPFSGPDFVCSSQNQKLPIPFRVNALPASLHCSITIVVGALTTNVFTVPGDRRLVVRFDDDSGKSHMISFCFNLIKETIEGVFTSPTLETRRFRGARCEKEEGPR